MSCPLFWTLLLNTFSLEMAYGFQILSIYLIKFRASTESPFLLRCNCRELKHEMSILLLSMIGMSISTASFLRSLFKLFTFLFIPSWSLLIVSVDRTMVVCGVSFFVSFIISLIVSNVFMPSFLVRSLVPQCTIMQSGFLHAIGRM